MKTLKHEEIIKYLNKHKDFLSIKAIADKVGMEQSLLHKAINKKVPKNCVNPATIPYTYIKPLSNLIHKIQLKEYATETIGTEN
jgi:hypothetical protein